MVKRLVRHLLAGPAILAMVAAAPSLAGAAPPPSPATGAAPGTTPPTHSMSEGGAVEGAGNVPSSPSADALLRVPVTHIYPNGISPRPDIKNPNGDDPTAAQRGMIYFEKFNCVGCHAPNGGGGMGPALSNSTWIYGSSPANIYLTISHGRPHGMPAWGGVLPPSVIWDLVSYIESISKAPNAQHEWGHTVSAKAMTIEQVPAEFQATDQPWKYTEPFSFGQKPQSPAK